MKRRILIVLGVLLLAGAGWCFYLSESSYLDQKPSEDWSDPEIATSFAESTEERKRWWMTKWAIGLSLAGVASLAAGLTTSRSDTSRP